MPFLNDNKTIFIGNIDYDVDMEDDEDWDPDGTMGGMVS